MKLFLQSKKSEAPNVESFLFRPEQIFSWQAGQYLFYVLEHANADDREMSRYFTIASAPHEQIVMLTTRFAPEGGSSFKRALRALSIGGVIEAEGPQGNFIVDDPLQDYVFIAGGIGITPFRAILLDLDNKQLPINVTMLYANKTPDVTYKDTFDLLEQKHRNLRVKYFIDPKRIDEAAIRAHVSDLIKPMFCVSGPKPMVLAFEKMLVAMGVPAEHVKRDTFPGYEDF